MELRTLRYFVYIAEARSFSNAAVHLRVAQPALSRQIGKLEAEIGMPLFLRTGRHLELTEAGQLLLTRAQALLRQATNALDEVRTFGSDLSGTVTVGVSPAATEILAPLIFRECALRHPKMKVRFVEGFSRLIFEQLVNQELTLCLFHNPPEHKAVEIHPLVSETMYLVGPPARDGGLKAAKAGMDLQSLPMILPNRTHALRRLLEEALDAQDLNIVVETDGIVTTRALVAAGVGYTILPYSAVHNQLMSGQVSSARLEDLRIPWTLSLACRTNQRSTRPVAAILDILNSQIDLLRG
jgi:LysR family transcriptional regulator, nitrogen assimilation regulatory protein